MASKSCKEFLTFKFPTVFKLFRHRVNASSNSATVKFFAVFVPASCERSLKKRLDKRCFVEIRILKFDYRTNLSKLLFFLCL